MKQPTRVSFAASLALLTPMSVFVSPALAQDQLWLTQLGTAQDESDFLAVARDDTGGAFIAGSTQGSLSGPNAGGDDVYLARYDDAGNQLWILQFGTTVEDVARALAPDGLGGVFVTGYTQGRLGAQRLGPLDAFVARYDEAGTQLWMRQFGTNGSDLASAVAPDGAGGSFVAGNTGNGTFLARFDHAGAQLWFRQYSHNGAARVFDLELDGAGGVMMSGWTPDTFSGAFSDAFVARFDGSGNQLWIRVFGTERFDGGRGLAADGVGGVMVTGRTSGDLGGPNAGGADGFLARYDSAGNQLWLIQFGTSREEGAFGLAPDGAGGVIVSGRTSGNFGGPNAGGDDVILVRFDGDGNQIWIRQFGSPDNESANALASDGAGGVMAAGRTNGSLGGPNAGGQDAFLVRYSIGPCYADCDQSTGVGILDIFDFLCFQNSFVSGEPYACDCDTTTGVGVCDVFDFLCFQNAFVGGCP